MPQIDTDRQIENININSLQTFYHFVGATSGSTDLYRFLNRFWSELLPADDPAPTDSDELRRSMETIIKKASITLSQKGKTRLVILVDALNQMDDDGVFYVCAHALMCVMVYDMIIIN